MIDLIMRDPVIQVDSGQVPPSEPGKPPVSGKIMVVRDPHSGIGVTLVFSDDQWDQLDDVARGSKKIDIFGALPKDMPAPPGAQT